MSATSDPFYDVEVPWQGSIFDGELAEDLRASLEATPDSSDLRLTESELGPPLGLSLDDALSPDFDIMAFEGEQASPEQGTGSCSTSLGLKDAAHGPAVSGDVSAPGATSSSGGAGSESCPFPQQESGSKRKTPPVEEDETKRQIRMARNRENAHLSRQRKKAQMERLESTCASLAAQVRALSAALGQSAAENELLRRHVAAAFAAAGVPAPELPRSALTPQLVVLPPAHPGAAPTVGLALPGIGNLAAAQVLAGTPPVATGVVPAATAGPAPPPPSVPTAAMPAAVPAPTVTPPVVDPTLAPVPAQACTPSPVVVTVQPPPPSPIVQPPPPQTTRRESKRARRAATGAGTAFLALLSLFMFAGPLTPPGVGVLPRREPSSAGGQAGVALPAKGTVGTDGGLAPYHRPGRALQSVVDDDGIYPRADETAPSAVALQSSDRPLSDALAELAPLALALESGGECGGALAPETAFPRLATAVLPGWGLAPPGTCRRVASVAADGLRIAPRSRQELAKFLTGRLGLQGRGLSGVAPPRVPKIEHEPVVLSGLQGTGGDDEESSNSLLAISGNAVNSQTVSSGDDNGATTWMDVEEPVMVTTLRANSSSSTAGVLRTDPAGEDLLVIMLEPGRRLATYACQQPIRTAGAAA